MASMLAIISKKQFKEGIDWYKLKGELGEILPWRDYESKSDHLANLKGGALFLVAVRPVGKLWLVSLHEKTRKVKIGISTEDNQIPFIDITHLHKLFKFKTGTGLSAVTGYALQTPRVLTAEDEKLLRDAIAAATNLTPPKADEEDPELAAFEGEKRTYFVTHRKRESKLRDAKIEAVKEASGKLCCEVPGCGFDFEEIYGEIGEDYIQVHHKKQLAKLEAPEKTKLSDLVVVCANCHAMIHRGGQCRTLEELIPAKPKSKKKA
jgi:hypothetical protein